MSQAFLAAISLVFALQQVVPLKDPSRLLVLDKDLVLGGQTEFTVKAFVADALKNDVSESTLKNSVELKMRQNGIGVTTVTNPQLYVSANAFLGTNNAGQETGSVIYSISVAVETLVEIQGAKDTKIRVAETIIWQTFSFGTIGRNNVRDLRSSIDDSVDKFLNAWLKANPKK